jgi:NADH:ubiquinone oxidoreductase subunit E
MRPPVAELDEVKSLEDEFEAEALQKMEEVIDKYKDVPGSLITVLHQVQGVLGFLPFLALKKIAKGLNLPEAEVLGVVTFYSFFSIKPRGKYIIKVCLGTACYVKGGNKIMEKMVTSLGITAGETTKDRLFSLEEVRCLGACGKAPVFTVNDDTHGLVDPADVADIVGTYRAREEG